MRHFQQIRLPLFSVFLAMVLLSGCASTLSEGGLNTTHPNPAEVRATCCDDPEPYPNWLAHLGLALAPALGSVATSVGLHDGHIKRHPQAVAYLTDRVQPLDLIVVQADDLLSHAILPGKFGHVAVYLGTEDELRRFGIWDHPRITPFHDTIRGGRAVLEADRDGVHLASFQSMFYADTMAVLRPELTSKRQHSIFLDLANRVGTPFDYQFDAGNEASLFCSQVVACAMPELDLPKREAYGRLTIFPDDIAHRAANGVGGLSLIAYVAATPMTWETGTPQALSLALDQAWDEPIFRQALDDGSDAPLKAVR